MVPMGGIELLSRVYLYVSYLFYVNFESQTDRNSRYQTRLVALNSTKVTKKECGTESDMALQ